jgi:hypothetical protein
MFHSHKKPFSNPDCLKPWIHHDRTCSVEMSHVHWGFPTSTTPLGTAPYLIGHFRYFIIPLIFSYVARSSWTRRPITRGRGVRNIAGRTLSRALIKDSLEYVMGVQRWTSPPEHMLPNSWILFQWGKQLTQYTSPRIWCLCIPWNCLHLQYVR